MMFDLTPLRVAAFATLAAMGAACNRGDPPAGQVIAVVGGEEVTAAELNEEARLRNLPVARDLVLRDAVIRDLIDRKLLVRAATERGLHRSPRHLLTVRRLSEIALAQQLLAAEQTGADHPTEARLRQFIATNPHVFDRRVVLSVDRINIAGTPSEALRRALAAAPSVEEMAKLVLAAKLNADRRVETWDSASLPAEILRQVDALQPGGGFVFVQGGSTIAGKVLSRAAQPIPEAQRLEVARAMVERASTERALQRILRQLRSSVRVEYQPDFAPGAKPAPR
jgi:peptidyl-prolyl cis-trans isomerase C